MVAPRRQLAGDIRGQMRAAQMQKRASGRIRKDQRNQVTGIAVGRDRPEPDGARGIGRAAPDTEGRLAHGPAGRAKGGHGILRREDEPGEPRRIDRERARLDAEDRRNDRVDRTVKRLFALPQEALGLGDRAGKEQDGRRLRHAAVLL